MTTQPSLKYLLSTTFDEGWYGDPVQAWWLQLLRPFSWLFRIIASSRFRRAEHSRVRDRGVPVIVVGNITVGGTGKTPLLMALAQELKRRGHRVGIVSRGYGGKSRTYPLRVDRNTPASQCGDEPAMLARRLGVPVVVDPQRARAIELLESDPDLACDVILSDDGLQHYAMARDLEIVVVDAARGFGNALCLPAGPLREPMARLGSVDMIVSNGVDKRHQLPRQFQYTAMALKPVACVNVMNGERIPVASFFRKQLLHGVAGIGNPSRFFQTLRDFGSQVIEHPFPDHYQYVTDDLQFGDALPILMTEKDAVKCGGLAIKNAWYLEVSAELPDAFYETVIARIQHVQSTRLSGNTPAGLQRGLFDEP